VTLNGSSVPVGGEVIYHLLTDRFSAGGAVLRPPGPADSGRHVGGDWNGVAARISDGYFTDLGVTHLWISPVVENVDTELVGPWGATSSYHGYWTRDFARHNRDAGSAADLRALLDAARTAGIGIIGDFAFNHTSPASDGDPSFMADGAWYDDGRLLASTHDDPEGMFLHFGDFCGLGREEAIFKNLFNLASLNHHHPLVDEVLKRRLAEWVHRGLAGVRLDAVRHMTPGWVRSLLSTLTTPLVFGEWFVHDSADDPDFAEFMAVTRCATLDFHVATGIRHALRDGKGWPSFVDAMARADRCQPHPARAVTFLDNHDMDRFLDDGADPALLHLALVLLLTTRGRPALYYGTEQYLTGAGADGNPGTRQVMPAFRRDTVAFRLIATLSRLRAHLPVLRYGDTTYEDVDDELLVVRRHDGGNTVVVALNRGAGARTVNLARVASAGPSTPDLLGGLAGGHRLDLDFDGRAASRLDPYSAALWHWRSGRPTARIGLAEPAFPRPGGLVTLGGLGLSGELTVRVGERVAEVVRSRVDELVLRLPDDVPPGGRDVSVASPDGVDAHTLVDAVCVVDGPLCPVRVVLRGVPAWAGEVWLATGTDLRRHGPMYDTYAHPRPDRYYDVALPVGRPVALRCLATGAGAPDGVWSREYDVGLADGRPVTLLVDWAEEGVDTCG
jgi:glycosidase